MLVVGLTGGIASGKSTVSRLIRERYDLTVIDLDVLAREVVEPGRPAYEDIVRDFGESVLLDNDRAGQDLRQGRDEDGQTKEGRSLPLPESMSGHRQLRSIDRKKLGALVFNDKAKLTRLNRYTHPRIYQRALWLILVAWFKGEKMIFLDVPLLIETGMWKRVGKVLLIYAAEAVQFRRLAARDAKGEEDARSRMRNQMPLDQKVPFADYVLDNSGDRSALEEQLHNYLAGLAALYADVPASKGLRSTHKSIEVMEHSNEWTSSFAEEDICSGLRGGFAGIKKGWTANGIFRLWFWLWLVEWLFPPAGIMTAGLSILWRTLFRSPEAIRASRKLREEREQAAAGVHGANAQHQMKTQSGPTRRRIHEDN